MSDRIITIIERIEAGETTISDAETLRQYINSLMMRNIANQDRLRTLQGAAWDVVEAAQQQGDIHGAVERLAAVSQYRWG